MRCHHELWNKDACAVSVHVRHASVEVQCNVSTSSLVSCLVSCMLCALFPIVVCDDAVVRRTLVSHSFSP